MARALAHTDVFYAVADPTRRAILDRLRAAPAPVKVLAEDFRVSRPAVSKHLGVLRRAKLVSENKFGRERIYKLEPDGLRQIAGWIEGYRLFWVTHLNQLKRHLESP